MVTDRYGRPGSLGLFEPVPQGVDRRYRHDPAEIVEHDRIRDNPELLTTDAHDVIGPRHAEMPAVLAAEGVVVAAL
jgi:hypothetical protein